MELENTISLTQKLKQKAIISPQQIQGVKMLELTTLELEERIQQELNNNPALEEADDDTPIRDDDGSDDNDDELDDDYSDIEQDTDTAREQNNNFGDLDDEDISGHFSDDDTYDSGFDYTGQTPYNNDYSYSSKSNNIADTDNKEIPFSAGTTFKEYLLDQVGTLQITPRERELVEYVLNNLDDDGLLTRNAHRMENDLLFAGVSDIDEQQLQRAIDIVQSLDPAGVGATSLEECLLLQLKRREQTDTTKIAISVVQHYFEELKNKHYKRISQRLGVSESKLKEAIDEISHLTPKPGQQWNGDVYERNANILVPDFYVTHRNGYWEIWLNNDNIPHLRVNSQYNQWATNYRENKDKLTPAEKESGKFAQPYVVAALGFIKNLNDRNTNLVRIMEAIVKAQEPFFLMGDDQLLKPLVLDDIASKVDLDVSTVSRVCKMKYVSCDVGTFQLKHFFSESITDVEGNEVSTRSVKSAVKEIIDHEDKAHPFNDTRIAKMIEKQGFPIARRTVAKYREQLGIPVARLRKEI